MTALHRPSGGLSFEEIRNGLARSCLGQCLDSLQPNSGITMGCHSLKLLLQTIARPYEEVLLQSWTGLQGSLILSTRRVSWIFQLFLGVSEKYTCNLTREILGVKLTEIAGEDIITP